MKFLSKEEIEKRVSDSYELPNKVIETVPKPMVTIRTSTYQHGPYIKECIEGVLMQKTNFPIEFIIGEDFSTDGTREIVFEYAKKYPNIIRVFTADYNVGSKANGQRCIRAARGKYMALCEGDDYWTDPLKLQKQVDFLERNDDFVLTYGNAEILDETGNYHKKGNYIKDNLPKAYSPIDAVTIGLPTLTMLFRKTGKFPDWYFNVTSGDYFLRLILSKYGKFYYHGELFGVHRKHNSGASRTNNKLLWNLNTAYYLNVFLPESKLEQKSLIMKHIAIRRVYAFYLSLSTKNPVLIFKLLFKILTTKGFYSKTGITLFIRLFYYVVISGNVKILDTF